MPGLWASLLAGWSTQSLCVQPNLLSLKKLPMSLLIKNGRIITATDDFMGDVLIEGETILAVGRKLNAKAEKEIDATGLLVMPGGIDPHVHLDMPFMGALMIDDRQMVGLMQEVKKQGGMVTVHATNGDMIDFLVAKHRSEGKMSPLYHYLSQPEITEAEASSRFADMIHYTGCPGYIVHMTCEGALNAIRTDTRRNQKVYVETCIQYLLLDASLYEKDF